MDIVKEDVKLAGARDDLEGGDSGLAVATPEGNSQT